MSTSIKDMLAYALDAGASDLHLSVGSIPMVRIHGEMKKLQLPIMDMNSMKKIRDDILNDNQKKLFSDKLEIDFSTALEDKGRFRVNFFNQINGMSAVFRAIPSEIKSCQELGVPPIMNQLAMKNKGLVLLTGPTGSGKSTTLAAMIDHINENKTSHIINKGINILPINKNEFHIGSTYYQNVIDEGPDELISKTKQKFEDNFTLIKSMFGIRSASNDRRPIIGRHKNNKRMYIINAMGSKGVSQAPYCTKKLFNFINNKENIDDEINIDRFRS